MKNSKLIIFCATVFMISSTYAQQQIEKHFYDELGDKTDSINAVASAQFIFTDTIKGSGLVKRFNIEGKLIEETEYSNINRKNPDIDMWTKHGISKTYNPDGYLQIIENYKDNKFDGEILTYYANNRLKRKDLFEAGEFLSGKCFDENGEEIEHFDYLVLPEYKEGKAAMYQFISSKLRYPHKMAEAGIEAKVWVLFTVTKEGEMENIRVSSKQHNEFEKEALRVVKLMSKFNPGIRDGENIDVKYSLPITFKFQ